MKKTLYIVLLLLLSVPAMAYSHIEARFRQVRESSMFVEPQVLTGSFAYTVPDRVRWQYDSGIQATLPEPMLRFITGAVDGSYAQDNDDFVVEQTADSLSLTPKKSRLKKLFSHILIRFGQNGLAEQVVMTEPAGDITTITFTDWHTTD
ncbi:MAG: outer membrane lipoprotein carrier protein LolA [Paludibacteraceae bacterium]|nr:outer membrane lipoprotein carrier protein LolA [Paludibacteraceae bacterium]